MGRLCITEYERMAEVTGGFRVSVGVEPAHAIQNIAFTGTAAVSVNFNVRTRFVRIEILSTLAAADLLFGAAPTAVAGAGTRLTNGQTEYFGCDPAAVATGLKVSAVEAA